MVNNNKKVVNRKDSHGQVLRVNEYQRADGLYEFKYRGWDGKNHSEYDWNLVDLRRKENKIRFDIDRGWDPAKGKELTLNDMYDTYIRTKHNIKPSTKRNYIYFYDKFIRDNFGKKRIGKINFMDVQNYYHVMLMRDEMLPTTLENLHTQIHPAFQLAVKLRYIPTNPSDGAMREIKGSELWNGKTRKREALTVTQQQVFTEHYKHHEILAGWSNIITFLLGTGCRIGETLGLTWDDVDFENREIHINRALLYRPNEEGQSEFHISSPKTAAGTRIILMIQEVYDALLEERIMQECICGKYNDSIDGVTDFVFTQNDGSVFNPGSINRAIARLIQSYNDEETRNAKREKREPVLLPHFSAHHLRHTFCTRLCATSLPIKQIQEIMGHSDINVTMKIYAQVNPETRRESLTKLEGQIIL